LPFNETIRELLLINQSLLYVMIALQKFEDGLSELHLVNKIIINLFYKESIKSLRLYQCPSRGSFIPY